MPKPQPPNGTPEDWMRYRTELALWEYFTRYKPLQEKTHA